MSTSITTPKNNVPVGRVTINGQTFDVQQHPEFVRFFFDLFRRVGGNSALTNTDLESAINSLSAGDMVMQPTAQEVAFQDVLQPATQDQIFPDVTQTFDATGFDELALQH